MNLYCSGLSNLTLIDDTDSLALAALDALRRDKFDFRLDAEHRFQTIYQLFLTLHDFTDVIGKHLGSHFYAYLEGIVIINAVYDDLIVCRITIVHKYGFDLRREYIDAADDQHIIGTSARFRHPDMRAAAAAFLACQDTDIFGAVADHRKCLFVNCRKDQFALCAIRQDLARIRINDLSYKMILIDMHSLLRRALK